MGKSNNLIFLIGVPFGVGLLIGGLCGSIDEAKLQEREAARQVRNAIAVERGKSTPETAILDNGGTLLIRTRDNSPIILYSLPGREDVFYSIHRIKQNAMESAKGSLYSQQEILNQQYADATNRIAQLTPSSLSNYFQRVEGTVR
jgi:hypothetical protein